MLVLLLSVSLALFEVEVHVLSRPYELYLDALRQAAIQSDLLKMSLSQPLPRPHPRLILAPLLPLHNLRPHSLTLYSSVALPTLLALSLPSGDTGEFRTKTGVVGDGVFMFFVTSNLRLNFIQAFIQDFKIARLMIPHAREELITFIPALVYFRLLLPSFDVYLGGVNVFLNVVKFDEGYDA